jgi:predicted acetyltransferase
VTDPHESYLLRVPTADDMDGFHNSLSTAFGATNPEGMAEGFGLIAEPERLTVVVYDGEVVGTAGVFTRELTVPGGPIPAAHVSDVSVQPTHRRRGLLRRMMTHQLTTVPEAIAVLWASEGRIYQRFGYGLATKVVSAEIANREVHVRAGVGPAEGRLRLAAPASVRKEIEEVFARVWSSTPGMSSRTESWWTRRLSDPEWRRQGTTPLRAVVFEDASGVTGYALWRVKPSWNAKGPTSEVYVTEVLATTPAGYAELWRFLLAIDLTRSVKADLVGIEEPLLYLVDSPESLGLRYIDGLWVRLVDLPRALVSRSYSRPVDTVIEVNDALLPANAGRWRLRVADDGSATCEPAGAADADVACDVADLGAAYLGGSSLSQLALAGRVHELRPGALHPLAVAFGWPVSPTAIEIF